MLMLRQDGGCQQLAKTEHSVWKVGPEQIVRAVVHAQAFMSEKNAQDDWVLKAAIRNGVLARRPNLEAGKFEELLGQIWTKISLNRY